MMQQRDINKMSPLLKRSKVFIFAFCYTVFFILFVFPNPAVSGIDSDWGITTDKYCTIAYKLNTGDYIPRLGDCLACGGKCSSGVPDGGQLVGVRVIPDPLWNELIVWQYYIIPSDIPPEPQLSTDLGKTCNSAEVGSTANFKTGNLYHDQQVGNLTFSYNSLDSYKGASGKGWTHNYNLYITPQSDGSLVLKAEDGNNIYFRLTNGICCQCLLGIVL